VNIATQLLHVTLKLPWHYYGKVVLILTCYI